MAISTCALTVVSTKRISWLKYFKFLVKINYFTKYDSIIVFGNVSPPRLVYHMCHIKPQFLHLKRTIQKFAFLNTICQCFIGCQCSTCLHFFISRLIIINLNCKNSTFLYEHFLIYTLQYCPSEEMRLASCNEADH